MKTPDHAAKLAKLLDRVAPRQSDQPVVPPWSEAILDADQPILNEFLRSFLIWEAGMPAARTAVRRLAEQVVDFNDLRVCLPHDLAEILGERYPLVAERADRLRAALIDLFRRTHAVSLEHVANLSKREARAYLDSLEGVPDFVSARVVLLTMDVHAMPMDQRTHARLVDFGAMPEDSAPQDGAEQIQRRVKAGELLGTYLGLQDWCDESADADAAPRRPRSRSPAVEDGESPARRER